jgi:hypothetical protein
MAICAICGTAFRAKRPDARMCSPRCRKAASRLAAAGQNGDVTDLPADHTSLAVTAAPAPAVVSGDPNVIDLARLAGDTIADRRWRIMREGGDFALQCEAPVPGGWNDVARERTMLALRRFAAWLGLKVEPVMIDAPLREAA